MERVKTFYLSFEGNVFPASYGLSGPDVQEFHVSEDSTVSLCTVWSNLPCPTRLRYASACTKWVFSPHSSIDSYLVRTTMTVISYPSFVTYCVEGHSDAQ
jgi:hypothetical protein